MFLRKCASVRDAESAHRRDVPESPPSLETLPSVISVARASRIKPPSKSKTMSPKYKARIACCQQAASTDAPEPTRPSVVEAGSSHPGAHDEPTDPESEFVATLGALCIASGTEMPASRCEEVPALALVTDQTLQISRTDDHQLCESTSTLGIQELITGSTANSEAAELNDMETQMILSTHTEEESSAEPDEVVHDELNGTKTLTEESSDKLDAQLGSIKVGAVRPVSQVLSSSDINAAHDEDEHPHAEPSDPSNAFSNTEFQAVQQEESFGHSPLGSAVNYPDDKQLQHSTLMTVEADRNGASESATLAEPQLMLDACDDTCISVTPESDTVSSDPPVLTDNQGDAAAIRLTEDRRVGRVLDEQTDSSDASTHNDEAEACEHTPLTGFEPIAALEEETQAISCVERATQSPEEVASASHEARGSEERSCSAGDAARATELCDGDSGHEPEVSIQNLDQVKDPVFFTRAWSESDTATSSSSRSGPLLNLVLTSEVDTRALFTPMNPESSPAHRATATPFNFVGATPVEISEHDSVNWLLPSLETACPHSSNHRGRNQDAVESPLSKAPLPHVESTPEPDFVMDRRPLRTRALLSPRDGRLNAKLSPGKRSLQPMNIFDFDDAWATLQRSRPSSLEKLDNLIKVSARTRALVFRSPTHHFLICRLQSTKQILAEDFGERSNQDEADDNAHAVRARPAASTVDECLQTMATYFAKRWSSKLRRVELKQKLRCFEAVLGLPGPLFDARALRVFVPTHQETVLQQHVDFCEAIVAQRVYKRLCSWQDAHCDSCFASAALGRVFLSRDQFAACSEWLEHKLHDRAYFQHRVLPLVLNGWIPVTPPALEAEDAWLAL
ncbi:hypothetical protein PybrP1_005272 [[Pythium] brassicae (nom. inval.)]|nr:hypothetical protein PybrP1_005272 [[Pythium] brassicae (nom. inval.)]